MRVLVLWSMVDRMHSYSAIFSTTTAGGADPAALLQEKLARARAMRPDASTSQQPDSAKSASDKTQPNPEIHNAGSKGLSFVEQPQVQNSDQGAGETLAEEDIPITLVQV